MSREKAENNIEDLFGKKEKDRIKSAAASLDAMGMNRCPKIQGLVNALVKKVEELEERISILEGK